MNRMSLKPTWLRVDIKIEGKFRKRIGLGGRFLVVYVDDEEQWKSRKISSSSPLRWQKDYHVCVSRLRATYIIDHRIDPHRTHT